MNLHLLTRAAVSSVNPSLTLWIQRSTGYTTNSDGSRTPTYAAAVPVKGQVQSLTYNDLQQVSGLNLQGERRAIYLQGNWEGVARPDGRGGDLITLPDGSIWLVAQVLENWGSTEGWVKVCVTRQNGS